MQSKEIKKMELPYAGTKRKFAQITAPEGLGSHYQEEDLADGQFAMSSKRRKKNPGNELYSGAVKTV